MMQTKICSICNTSFLADRKIRKYCSRKCYLVSKNNYPKVKCSIVDCENNSRARGWCPTHWLRWKVHGDPNYQRPTICLKENCDRGIYGKGLCKTHFLEKRRIEGHYNVREQNPHNRYMRLKRDAKRNKIEVKLTEEQYVELISPNACHYCAGELPKTCIGLDKKDSGIKEYSLENSVPCCTLCNKIKSNLFTYEEFLQFSKMDFFKKVTSRIKTKFLERLL